MMTASAYGRLGKDPKAINTSTGTPMASASIAVDVSTKRDPDATHWLRILAFGQAADALMRHQAGECIAFMGRIQANRGTDKDGAKHDDLQLIADSLTSARTARSGTCKRRGPDESSHPKPERGRDDCSALVGADEFNDALAF